MPCWTLLEPGSPLDVCGARLELLPAPGGGCVYRRTGGAAGGGVFEARLPSCRLRVAAAAPVLYPLEARPLHGLLRLEPPVHVPGGGVFEARLSLGVDVAVLDGEGGLVDVYPSPAGWGGLGLYGPPRGGLLARLLHPLPRGSPCSLGAVVRIVNQTPGPLRVSRLLLPLSPARIAEDPAGCSAELGEVEAVAQAPSRMLVRLRLPEEPPRGWRWSPASPAERLLAGAAAQQALLPGLPLPLPRLPLGGGGGGGLEVVMLHGF